MGSRGDAGFPVKIPIPNPVEDIMKPTLLALSLILLVCLIPDRAAAEAPPTDAEDMHVYLLIGQSNMAGRAPIAQADSKPMKGVFLLNGEDAWEVASNPLNRFSTIRKGLGMQKLNPGYSFALEMQKESKGKAIGLVVNAKGGTKIEQWKKGTKFYQEAIRRAQEAQKSGTLKGILWHQGESNQGNPEGYADQLKQLVVDLREDLGVKELPFIAGQVNKVPKINEQIAQLPEILKATAYVSSEGLKCMDRWHFDAASAKELGNRYAEAMKKLLK